MKSLVLFIVLALLIGFANAGDRRPKPQPPVIVNEYITNEYITEEYITNEYVTEEYTTNEYYSTECDYCDGYAAASVAGDNIHFDHDKGLQGGIAAGKSGSSSALAASLGGNVYGALVSGSVFLTKERKKGFGAGVSWEF